MRISTSVSIKTLIALGVVGASGLAAAQSSSTQAAAAAAQPSNNPGLVAGLLTTTGAATASTIGSTVGAIAGAAAGAGGGAVVVSALPAGVTRLALPGQGGTGAAAAPGGKAWNAWFAVSRNTVSYDYAPLQSSGNVRVGLIGVDYTFNNNIVAGLAIAGDKTDINLNFIGGKLTGKGTTYSPYVGIPLNKNWSADVSVGWGKTTVDTEITGITSRMTDNRRTASLGMSYRRMAGNDNKWMLTGRGSYLAVRDKLGAYTMSNGTFVPDSSVSLSQLRFGGQAAYNLGVLVPYAGLNYIYDVSAPSQAGAANDRDAFQAVLGLKFSVPSGFYGGLQYSSELNRSQIKNNQIMLNMGARF
ncbi:MAG: autotransporter outer membrane beta-barrel domain-containing protein [Sulfuritalea sp.]|nr:autotransporter outer membrane beta-barrel domain-containing protein [Sulfuritalea sp.]